MVLLLALACVPPVPAQPSAGPEFWDRWGDGNAEVSSFALTQPRYGALYPGTAVLITVTEDFSWSERVKADPGQHPDADVRKVVKLNSLRTFDTGIYTYNVMTSVFARVDAGDGMAPLDPIKIAFSAQEWCGMVYDELTMGPGVLHLTTHTYFDSDTAAPATERVPEDVVYGDAIPLLIRGLRGEWLAPGQSRTVPWWSPEIEQRFAHVKGTVGRAKITRSASSEDMTTPAGTFRVQDWEVAVEGGPTTTWFVEMEGARRIVGWKASTGEHAELKGSDRLPYWQMHGPDDAGARARVGL
jgi:hypothetical protein